MITMMTVPWHDVDTVWPKMIGYLEDAVAASNGTLTSEAIRACLKERDMQAMVAVDEDDTIVGVMITEIVRAVSDLTFLNVVALAGDRFDEWRSQANELLKKWAESLNAPFVMFNGRRGWLRRLADIGWKETSVVMSLDLRN